MHSLVGPQILSAKKYFRCLLYHVQSSCESRFAYQIAESFVLKLHGSFISSLGVVFIIHIVPNVNSISKNSSKIAFFKHLET